MLRRRYIYTYYTNLFYLYRDILYLKAYYYKYNCLFIYKENLDKV